MPRHCRLATVLALLTAFASTPACQGPTTEEDLQLWTRNDRGFERLNQVITDPNEPLNTKVRALEIVVEKGFPRRTRQMLEPVELEARKPIVAAFRTTMFAIVENPAKSKVAPYAKDALLMMERYFTPAEVDDMNKRIAKWAFEGITWSSSVDAVKKVGERISTGQIMDLGQYAHEGAAILMSHGFKVDKVIAFLLKPLKKEEKKPAPGAPGHLLRAMKLLHQRIGAQQHHLDALAKIPSPAAAVYLYDLYLNPDVDEQLKNTAFNMAEKMLEDPSVKSSKAIIDKIFALFSKSPDPDDRWTATNYLLNLSGTKHLERALQFFKDDKKYNLGEADADRQLMDLCLDIHERGLSPGARPIWHKLMAETNTNRITKTMAIVCSKAQRDQTALTLLMPMVKAWEKKETPEEQLDLDDFIGNKITLKLLLSNVTEGLTMLAAITAEHQAKTLNDIEYEYKERAVIFPLDLIGEEYAKRVAEEWASWQVKYKAEPKEFDEEIARIKVLRSGKK